MKSYRILFFCYAILTNVIRLQEETVSTSTVPTSWANASPFVPSCDRGYSSRSQNSFYETSKNHDLDFHTFTSDPSLSRSKPRYSSSFGNYNFRRSSSYDAMENNDFNFQASMLDSFGSRSERRYDSYFANDNRAQISLYEAMKNEDFQSFTQDSLIPDSNYQRRYTPNFQNDNFKRSYSYKASKNNASDVHSFTLGSFITNAERRLSTKSENINFIQSSSYEAPDSEDLDFDSFTSDLLHELQDFDEGKQVFPVVQHSEDVYRNYSVSYMRLQRILTATSAPSYEHSRRLTEVFIKHIPHNANEEELIPFLEKAGVLYKLRLMLKEKGNMNRGYAYATYFTPQDAKTAIEQLQKHPFRPGVYLCIKKSVSNNKLFIGCIPNEKTKDEVWQELIHQGINNIVDVIMYRSYSNRAENRGYVFVEFSCHEEAATARLQLQNVRMWGIKVAVDWSVPVPEVDEQIMAHVSNIFIRNLSVLMPREDLMRLLHNFMGPTRFEKVYKFKDYAFIHMKTRQDAQYLMECLQNYYRDSHVQIMWAKPPSPETKPLFRLNQVAKMKPKAFRQMTNSLTDSLSGSSRSLYSEPDMVAFNYQLYRPENLARLL